MKQITTIALSMMLAMTQADAARGKRPARDEGPDLPWPCWMVRLNAKAHGLVSPLTPAMKRKVAQLEKEHGITPKQHRQAEECFKA